MSDAEIRHRKQVQGHVSQATGALGLAALGGTMAASRGGRNTLRKIPALKSKIKKPPPRDPNRDRIKGGVTPVLATSAGLGGIGSFNFAAYTNAESRKRQKNVVKDMSMEMGYYGDEGHRLSQDEIEKAWSPSASTFDSEASRKKRSKGYEAAALVGAGGSAAYTARHGKRAIKAARKLKSEAMAPVETKVNSAGKSYRSAPTMNETKAIRSGSLKAVGRHGGKAATGAAVIGAAAVGHQAIKRKRKSGSWQSYETH